MLTCGFIIAQPRIGPLGLLSAVYFAFASNIDNVMTYDAVAFLNSSLAILVGIAVAVVLFATFFPETPAFAVRRFRKQLVAHLGYLAGASRGASALPCYQRALCEQLGASLARVNDDPKAARASAQADEIKWLNGIIVGAQTLGSDLTRARMILQGNSDALRL